jgi:predicted nucleic acid-binding Zn ribbon protein
MAFPVRKPGEGPRGPQKIADVLSALFAKRGYGGVQALSALHRAWLDAAGEALAGSSRPGKIRSGILQVVAQNSIVVQELTFQKQQILARLTELVPELKITGLKFSTGKLS